MGRNKNSVQTLEPRDSFVRILSGGVVSLRNGEDGSDKKGEKEELVDWIWESISGPLGGQEGRCCWDSVGI